VTCFVDLNKNHYSWQNSLVYRCTVINFFFTKYSVIHKPTCFSCLWGYEFTFRRAYSVSFRATMLSLYYYHCCVSVVKHHKLLLWIYNCRCKRLFRLHTTYYYMNYDCCFFYYDFSIYALLFNFSNCLHRHEHFQILPSYSNNYDLVSILILSFGTR